MPDNFQTLFLQYTYVSCYTVHTTLNYCITAVVILFRPRRFVYPLTRCIGIHRAFIPPESNYASPSRFAPGNDYCAPTIMYNIHYILCILYVFCVLQSSFVLCCSEVGWSRSFLLSREWKIE